MRKVSIAVFALAAACAPAPYVVVPKDQEPQEVQVGSEHLFALKADGGFIWRKRPEEVVAYLLRFGQAQAEKIAALQQELAKAKEPAKPAPAPEPVKAAAAPVEPVAKVGANPEAKPGANAVEKKP